MWLFLWIFVLLCKQNSGNSLDNRTPNKYSERRSKYVIRDEKIDQIKLLDKAYSSTNWQYNRYCQFYFPITTTPNKCTSPPNTNDRLSCFGHAIDYSYVSPENQILTASFGFLEKFPSCWKKISPVICAYFYRPCAYKATTNNRMYIEEIKQKENTTRVILPANRVKKNELWQILPVESCLEAESECHFLKPLGLWPSFLSCRSPVEAKMFPYVPATAETQDFKLFGGQCKIPYNIKSSGSRECVWPLVFEQPNKNGFGSPVIDSCYLPCRSALVSSAVPTNAFYVLSLLVAVFFLAFFIYLLPLLKHIEVFILIQSSFWTATHYLLLSLPFFNAIFEATACVNNGQIRKSAKTIYSVNISSLRGLGELLSLCNLQSMVLTFSILCSYYWLTVFLIRRVYFLLQQRDYLNKYTAKKISSRWLYTLIYPITAIYCISITICTAALPNGILGVCYVALEQMNIAAFVWAPMLLLLTCLTLPVLFCVYSYAIDWLDGTAGNRCREAHTKGFTANMEPNISSANFIQPLINKEREIDNPKEIREYRPSLLTLAQFTVIYSAFWLSLIAFFLLNYLLYENGSASEKHAILQSIMCSINAAFSKPNNSTYTSPYQSYLGKDGCELLQMSIPTMYLLAYLIIFPALPLATAHLCLLRKIMTQANYMADVLCFRPDVNSPFDFLPSDLVSVPSICAGTITCPLNRIDNGPSQVQLAPSQECLTQHLMRVPSTVSGLPVEEPESIEACESLVIESDANNYSSERLMAWLENTLPSTHGGSAKSLQRGSTEISTPSFKSDPLGMHPRYIRQVVDQRDLAASSAGSYQTSNITSASSFATRRAHLQNDIQANNGLLPPLDFNFINAVYAFNLGKQFGETITRQMWMEQMVPSSTSIPSYSERGAQIQSDQQVGPQVQGLRQVVNTSSSGDNNIIDEEEEEVDEDTTEEEEASSSNMDATTVVDSDYNDDERYPDSDEERMLKKELEKHRQHCLTMSVQSPNKKSN